MNTHQETPMRLTKRAAMAFVAIGLGSAMPFLNEKPSTAVAASANSSANSSLNRRIVEAKFENKTLGEAIEWIREVAGANVTVNWRALAESNITPETQINLRLYNVTLRKLLATVLTEAGAGNSLTYLVDEGVIEITTQQLADARTYVKIYNIEDLLFEVPNFDQAPDFNISQQGGQGGSSGGSGGKGGGGGGGSPLFGGGGGQQKEEKIKSRDERAQELVDLIVNTVRPEIWKENGGTSSIRYFNGNLVISAPLSVHEMIGG
jgi:uncharacterized membrane protein YgcG